MIQTGRFHSSGNGVYNELSQKKPSNKHISMIYTLLILIFLLISVLGLISLHLEYNYQKYTVYIKELEQKIFELEQTYDTFSYDVKELLKKC